MLRHGQALDGAHSKLFEKRGRAFTESLRDCAASDVDAGHSAEQAPNGGKAALGLDCGTEGTAQSELEGSDLLRRASIESTVTRKLLNLASRQDRQNVSPESAVCRLPASRAFMQVLARQPLAQPAC
jgi:hypothetical protein